MKNISLNRAGAKVVLWFLILAMLGFTATRTLHFLIQTFPPDQQYVAYLALAAFDVGVLGWLYYATNSAEGTGQRVVAYGMIFVCAAGVVVTTIADMLMVSAENGVTNKLPPDVATAALWAVMIVIALNFFAGILVHLLDPKHQKHMVVENAKDKIHNAVHEAIGQRAGEMAPRIAERVAAYWEEQTVQEMLGHIPLAKGVVPPASSPVAQLPSAPQSPVALPAVGHSPVAQPPPATGPNTTPLGSSTPGATLPPLPQKGGSGQGKPTYTAYPAGGS